MSNMRRRTAAPSTLERSASLGVPTSLPPRAVLQRGSSVGTTTIASQGTPRTHKSKFKRAYKKIMVPPVLEQGVPVTVSFEDDRRPKKHYMTLSRDKFTLYISPKPLDEDFFKEKKDGIRHASWLSKLRRSSSLDSASSSAEGEIQAIGIGAIHRIQRGAHNANLKTTTNSVAKVQNLKRRSSAESAKSKLGDSFLLSLGSTPNSSFHTENNGSSQSVQASIITDITNPGRVANANFDFKNPDFNNDRKSGSSKSRLSWSTGKTEAIIEVDPGLCFSIIYNGNMTLDLMMTDFDIMKTNTSTETDIHGNAITRDEIIEHLEKLMRIYSNARQKASNEISLLRYVWADSDQNQSDTISIDELGMLFNRINYEPMDEKESKKAYDQFVRIIGLPKKDQKRGLSFEQTCTLLHKTKRDSWIRKPIHEYWNTMFGELMNNGKPRMHVSNKTFLERFLHNKQGEDDATLADVNDLFKRLNEVELPRVADGRLPKDNERICRDRFEVYLLSEDNDAFDPRMEAYKGDTMNRPISEYWINSSHNTYLTGDQLTSESSIDMYSNILHRGCKCLELDCWDGGYGNDGEPVPIVYHGHTITSKILYKDIIKAIKIYVTFNPDTFPLILSYENHCAIPFQEVMAAQLVEILGKSLYIPTEESLKGRLPSPSDLRGMVVIKGRRPVELDDLDDKRSELGAPSTIDTSTSSLMNTTGSSVQKGAPTNVCPALARLTLLHGTKFVNWEQSLDSLKHYMHSFSETKFQKLSKKSDCSKWVMYNRGHMSRTYPAGARIDSSNYSPMVPWALGCQLVALNLQTVDAYVSLNDGKFRENGGCGYVLKPDNLVEHFGHLTEYNRECRTPTKLYLKVVRGSCLPKPNGLLTGDCTKPYVKVTVFDVRNGNKEILPKSQQTEPALSGFYPVWQSDEFVFKIENYETAMVQMNVYNKNTTAATVLREEPIASSSIPIRCLRQGLRSVKLFDNSNTRTGAFNFASLLIDVKKKKARSDDSSTIVGSLFPSAIRETPKDRQSTMAEI